MAFVKDDIGNWNLKSFDNDPSKLLNAYSNIGTSMLSTATDLISGSGSISDLMKNIDGAQKSNQAANNILLGAGTTPSASAATVKAIEERVQLRLQQVTAELAVVTKELREKLNENTAEITTLNNSLEKQQKSFADASNKIETANEKLIVQQNALKLAIIDRDSMTANDDATVRLAAHEKVQQLTGLRDNAQSDKDQVEKEVATVINSYQADSDQLAALKAKQDEWQKKLNSAPELALARIREIMDSHGQLIEGLQVSLLATTAESATK